MMMSVPVTRPAQKTTVLTLVKQTPAARMPSVEHPIISQSADAQRAGEEIHTRNVSNVGSMLCRKSRTFGQIFSTSFFPSVQCQRDEDCPFDKTCKSNECVDPCPLTICGSRATCKPQRHKGICVCPPGLQGNPYVSCTEVGCQSHEDCSDNEKCDFPSPSSGKRECVRLCITPSCAQGARCEAKSHREICTCNYPLQGDGYTSCLERKLSFCGREFKDGPSFKTGSPFSCLNSL